MTMRLFAAVVPPPAVLDALDACVEPRRDADPNLRWAGRHHWHLTLGFFGDVTDDRLQPLQQALGNVHGTPFTLTLDGAGTFPNPSKARVLYQGVTDGSDELGALSRRVRTAADRVGVPADNAKHVPHLTLARTRRPTPLTRWLTVVSSFPRLSFEVAGFVLMRSELHRSGPDYRVLQSVGLDGRPRTD